mmetsp:Transcript_19669/g.27660  ORF Transcript_19669/g.27660 Transcript_19669/m.27660 type:complete len:158 (-) Transcript_19669:39-512(-)|eukprot:CAMPEP_0184863016 /NCGR_PEP_ID=MMETSP0580-20130426/8324_1 /TAXON_ID=1118495 /ORGANISM="Dactyliosolen fragilissimus" /LENGTH=157 /DNA_ID=CAMNT_0027361059 /DNA_START=51 /DNA_END=524 /DNA_ORIENTATION=+
MSTIKKSACIPMPSNHIFRTNSELQLCEDIAIAEWRDRCMYNRLVNGVRRRQRHLVDSSQIIPNQIQHKRDFGCYKSGIAPVTRRYAEQNAHINTVSVAHHQQTIMQRGDDWSIEGFDENSTFQAKPIAENNFEPRFPSYTLPPEEDGDGPVFDMDP